jgi:rubrerythrin
MITRYGSIHPLQNVDLQKSAAITRAARTAEEHKDALTKRRQTLKNKFGYENLWENPEYRRKIQETNRAKYGHDWVQQHDPILQKRVESRRDKGYDALSRRFSNADLISSREDYKGINFYNGGDAYEWQCRDCGNIWTSKVAHGEIVPCRECYPMVGKSRAENEIAEFLSGIDCKFSFHDRDILKTRELDIYLPDHRIAIEHCGLYWHSETKVGRKYHREKLEECRTKGVRLFTIFEDEWTKKRSICESRLLVALGKSQQSIYARKCEIREVNATDARIFIDNHHLQGYVGGSIRLGLFHRNELCAIMTFGKPRLALNSAGNDGFEMIRYCSNGRVVGGAGKLFSHFIFKHQPTEIISYCDLRWGTGDLYRTLGFVELAETSPGYWYTNGNNRFHRFGFTKQKLVKQGFDASLTEQEIMYSRGFYKIWDCGNSKFKWTLPLR